MALRNYANAPATTLNGSVTNVAGSIVVTSATGFPISFPYTLIIDRGTASEEAVSVTAAAGNTLTVTRAIDSTTAFSHASGAVVEHGITAQDIRESNAHVNASSGVHGLTGSVVGTSDAQTLTNKTLTSPAISGATLSGATKVTSTLLDTNGLSLLAVTATASAVNFFTLANAATGSALALTASGTDPNVSINLVAKGTGTVQANGVNLLTLSNTAAVTNKDLTSGTNTFPVSMVTLTGSQTLTNKTLTSPLLITPSLISPTIDTLAGVTGVGQRRYIEKASDESRASTNTYADDSTLVFSVVANATYQIDLVAQITGTANSGGLKVQLNGPAGSTYANGTNAVAFSANPLVLINFVPSVSDQFSGSGFYTATLPGGRIKTSATAGTVAMQWAQNSSNATGITCKAGSYLVVTRVA